MVYCLTNIMQLMPVITGVLFQEIRRLYHTHVCEDVQGNQRLPLEARPTCRFPGC